MNYLLIAVNAKYIHSNLAVYDLRAYAASYFKEKKSSAAGEKALDPHIDLAEYTIHYQPGQILADLYQKKPDVAAFSCYIWNIGLITQVVRDLKKVLPQVQIWLGGPEVSYRAEEILQELPQVDVVLCGEGEEIFTQLVEEQERRAAKPCVATAQKEMGQRILRCTQPMDLDQVPFVYEDLSAFQNKILYYESSRGCPFSCSYCLSSVDKQLRFRSLNLVKQELDFFLEHQVKQVKFVDRTFNCNREHALAIWRYLLEHDNGVTNFHFEAAADLFTQEELEVLSQMRPGLIQLEVGVQSTNPRTIEEIHRVTHWEKVSQMVRQIQTKGNIHLHLDLIAGLPYEDYSSFGCSFNQVYELRPHQLQLGFLKILSGSYLGEHTDQYDTVYHSEPPYEVLSTRWISYGELLQLKQVEEAVDLYYNSHQFDLTLPLLEQEFPSPFALYEALGDQLAAGRPQYQQHSRMDQYRHLLAYLKQLPGLSAKKKELFRYLLVLDAYYREPLKSRPEFADSLEPWKKEIRKIYQEEASHPQWLQGYGGYDGRQLAGMTHLERIPFRLDTLLERNTVQQEPQWVLFDYRHRSAITGNAQIFMFSQ